MNLVQTQNFDLHGCLGNVHHINIIFKSTFDHFYVIEQYHDNHMTSFEIRVLITYSDLKLILL